MSEPPARATREKLCEVPNWCPICARPNDCRLEAGDAFKGPCWCAHLVVAPTALERLMGHVAERRCLCRTCLERIAADPEVTWEGLARG